MLDTDLIAPMTAAARASVAQLPRTTITDPPRTAAELGERFGAIDAPAGALLRARLTALRPDAVWTDEQRVVLPEHGEAWVVDPMDGAVQYLRGLPQWCVSLALVRDREPVATVLHSPWLGETVTAARGGGAYRDGVALRPSDTREPAVALVATSQPPTVRDEPDAVARAGASLSAVLPSVGAVRNLGPTSWQIADVAGGRLDGFWQFGTDDANLLGASLVAAEAGAVVTDAHGATWTAGARGFVAAPPLLHGRLLELIGGSSILGVAHPGCGDGTPIASGGDNHG